MTFDVAGYRRWQARIRSRALTKLARRHHTEMRDLLAAERFAEPWPTTTTTETEPQ